MKAPPKNLPPKEQLQMIRLPLHFHLLTGFSMRAFEKDMDIRVTCEQLQAIVLPEVNRIWKQAGIAFVYKGCSKHSEPPTSGQRQAGHPPNDSTKTSNLMGGPSPPGYKIAPDQIKKSRTRAKEIIKKFKTTSTLNLLI